MSPDPRHHLERFFSLLTTSYALSLTEYILDILTRQQTRALASHVGPSMAANGVEAEPAPPLFNTTFSTHSVSPLYIGPEGLSPVRLELLARRLRDTLVGDVVRGIQVAVGATNTPSGQVGSLRNVAIRRFELRTILGEEPLVADDAQDERRPGGIWIEISHERAAYAALLLPGLASSSSRQSTTVQFGEKQADVDASQFLHLPLLLLRMPQSLRAVVCEWLSTTFDCRIRKLSLGTRTLVSVMEDWLDVVGLPAKGPDLVLSFGFNVPLVEQATTQDAEGDTTMMDDEGDAAGLRVLEVTMTSSDVSRFRRYGLAKGAFKSRWERSGDERQRRRLAGGNVDDGWAWRGGPTRQPLMEGLARYLEEHLGLDVFHPGVRVVQVSCGSFVLAPWRLKLVKGRDEADEGVARAAWAFATRLGERVWDEAG